MSKIDITPATFRDYPENLELLLSSCLDVLIPTIENYKVSAAFVILDATVNPTLANAANSRAGIFLKNLAPNAFYESPTAIRYMRGPNSIAKEHHMVLMPQWQMEFTVNKGDFFDIVLHSDASIDLSKLYYWQPKAILAGDYEQAMILAVPLIASDQSIIGVCGLEISDMLFKMNYTPDNTSFSRIFAMLAPLNGITPVASQAMMAGSYTVISAGINGDLAVKKDDSGFTFYSGPDGATYAGLGREVSLYTRDSFYQNNVWLLSVLIPHQDLINYVSLHQHNLSLQLLALCLVSAVAALLLSQRYLKPIVETLRNIQHSGASSISRTQIPEIDDLIEYLHELDSNRSPPPAPNVISPEPPLTDLFAEFVQNIETLSPAERAVFNLYMKGHKAKDIAEILCLSINTIKTHNKRIYMKLKVSSRNELLLYVRMLNEKGGVVNVSSKQ